MKTLYWATLFLNDYVNKTYGKGKMKMELGAGNVR